MPDVDLARVRVALRVAVEELAQERAAGTLDLGDEDERLANLDQVLEPQAAQLAVLVELAEPLPARLRRALRRPGAQRPHRA
jgi:hypothetical protein